MVVALVAMRVLAEAPIAPCGDRGALAYGLGAPKSRREVTVRPVMGVHVHMTPMAMGSSISDRAGHGRQKLLVR